ncbi:MAG TPA: hypothetical protein VIA45_01215 [Thermoanaerobaculia bacterium]
MKTLVVIPPAAGTVASSPERRKHQRRMGLPRRLSERRNGEDPGSLERRMSSERRGTGNRRRRPDRRIGLSPDLDLYLIGI